MKKRLLLIKPVNQTLQNLKLKLGDLSPPLALGILAALTPENWEVSIVDEEVEPFTNSDADLAGLTSFTHNAPRAYEIASILRKRGVTTVMGGIHASMLPQEALEFVDVVVIGEAENIWRKVIADFEAGTLQKTYQGEFKELKNMPMARYDLFHPRYVGATWTTRGCPMNCSFCSVAAFHGKRYRHRPIEEVLDEIEKLPRRFFYFLDDNIVGYGKENEERAISLFKGIIDRGIRKKWAGQVSINFAQNPDVLKYAAKSGCCFVTIGIEAERADALIEMGKFINVGKDYKEAFRRIHRYGIAVRGFFMYGYDVDTPETIRSRTNYIKKCGVDSVGTSVVCPFPGTKLYDKMRDEKRLRFVNYPDDWARYHFLSVAQKPKLMEVQELENIMLETYQQLYNRQSILLKFFRTLLTSRNLFAAFVAFKSNKHLRNQKWSKILESSRMEDYESTDSHLTSTKSCRT